MNNEQKKRIKNPAIEKKFETAATSMTGKSKQLGKAIWKCYQSITVNGIYRWYPYDYKEIYAAYAVLCESRVLSVRDLDSFWNPLFAQAMTELFGSEDALLLKRVFALILETPYSRGEYRPSYRSKHAGDYAELFFSALIQVMDYMCLDVNLADIIRNNDNDLNCCQYHLALALRDNDPQIHQLVSEAILGEGDIPFSRLIVQSVIMSGVQEQIENLGKLLLAAQRQEGVRQAILENADCGSCKTHAYFIQLICDNDLHRFSSVVRAFETWTGLAYSEAKPAIIQKCFRLAALHLGDETQFDRGLESADTLEIYMALWTAASRDLVSARKGAAHMVDAGEKYTRLVGWYFLCSTIHKRIIHPLAMEHMDVRDPEELAWIGKCLHTHNEAAQVNWTKRRKNTVYAYPDQIFPDSKEIRQTQFQKLSEVLIFIGQKHPTFTDSIFPWTTVQLDADDFLRIMMGLAGYDCDPEMIEQLTAFLPIMDAHLRRAFYINLLNPHIPQQHDRLLMGLSDKSTTVKDDIISILSLEELTEKDIDYLTQTLKTQSSALRKSVMSLLAKQDIGKIRPSIAPLLHAKNSKQILAGLELIDLFGTENPSLLTDNQIRIKELQDQPKLSNDIQVILGHFNNKKDTSFDPENGYGLYDPSAPDFDKNVWAGKRPRFRIYSKNELEKILTHPASLWEEFIKRVHELIMKNKDLECEVEYYNGTREIVLLGNNGNRLPPLPKDKLNSANGHIPSILDYYLGDEILALFDALRISHVSIAILTGFNINHPSYGCEFTPKAIGYLSDIPSFYSGNPIAQYVQPYADLIMNILGFILNDRHEGVFDFAMSIWMSLVSLIPESEYLQPYEQAKSENHFKRTNCMLEIGIISEWRELAYRFIETDTQFIAYWNEVWYEYLATQMKFRPAQELLDLPRSHKMQLVSDHALYHELLSGIHAQRYIQAYTQKNIISKNARVKISKNARDQYPYFSQIIDKVVDRIVTIEEKRGELPTKLSILAANIQYFEGGIEHFIALLSAFGKDNFDRGYIWYYYSDNNLTKQLTLSILLKRCHPKPTDTPEALAAAIKDANIAEKRILQAIMYAPHWADLAEKAIGIKGLASAVWLFHAHINERADAEKETKIALYSPISQQQFADGTFDKDWLLEAYDTIGEKYFDILYKNAKYITTSNSSHRRSQMYVDATFGRLNKADWEAEIAEKRNQEKLRAYGLIPLDPKDPKDALDRYEFIQRFAKESKQFGSQRKASEAKAVSIALENLALTMGFGDTDRMSWYLESEKMDNLRHLMKPQTIGETEVWLHIDEDGTPSAAVSKNGKTLKTIPKALAKNDAVLEIKAAVKDLRDQKKRARLGFELAMTSRIAFNAEEIHRLLNHPVLSPMISMLVFVSKHGIGFPIENKKKLCLASPDESLYSLTKKDTLTIAHPHDLIEQKCWSHYQQYLYQNTIIQPFKQVFREYYPITEDELAAVNVSRRYAGQQVQPKKTVALLKTRGWTVDYEEGLQRVYHRENLIAKMYAMADWYSPSDIEAPTLEIVQFYNRNDYKPVAFEAVPPVIFSEVMRDIDLVVSVAHVGGVDPEASHSTVEMRVAIAKELLALLHVENVAFQANHAHIKGSMGEYSVHMGSGVVHQSGVGMIAILPVHSQARGRIFLPFADSDPRTAEIMSKILLLAEDKKIKDPAILSQMKKQ